jgi:histone deacetylase complex regulatory component SIN3
MKRIGNDSKQTKNIYKKMIKIIWEKKQCSSIFNQLNKKNEIG